VTQYQVTQKLKTNTYILTDLSNMNITELLNIFSQFTKEDWIEFDRLKSLLFEPTEEELEEQARQQEEQKQLVITSKLQAI
jgi:predicted ATP-dependent Lon-type protease